jgi:disulfide bond formation protein DsbB
MFAYLDTFNQIISLGVIFLQVVILVLLLNFIFFRSKTNRLLIFFKKYTFIMGFLIAFGAVSMSLFYSEVIGFPPCELCWIQRIFLYPQLVLFGMELYKRERSIVDFSIVFAILGSITSLYHVYIERGGESALPCAAPGVVSQVSCATRYVYEFSYVTIPVMALTLSLFLILILWNYKYMTRE